MENQCEVLNRSSCCRSANYKYIFVETFSSELSTAHIWRPASAILLETLFSPSIAVTAKGQAEPACKTNSLRQNPEDVVSFVAMEIRGAGSWREATRVPGSGLVSMHSVSLRRMKVCSRWMARLWQAKWEELRRDVRPQGAGRGQQC